MEVRRTNHRVNIELNVGARPISLEGNSKGISKRGAIDVLGPSANHLLGKIIKDVVIRADNIDDTIVDDLKWWWYRRSTSAADGSTWNSSDRLDDAMRYNHANAPRHKTEFLRGRSLRKSSALVRA